MIKSSFYISVQIPITNALAAPLVALLKSSDPEILKAATLAISNFTLNGPGRLKIFI
jgi:hypothetical protein